MTREDLRDWVCARWGARLERPTIAEIRAALPELQALVSPPPEDGVFVLDTAAADYETAMREFFGDALGAEIDGASVHLWLTALELWVAVMTREERDTDRAP